MPSEKGMGRTKGPKDRELSFFLRLYQHYLGMEAPYRALRADPFLGKRTRFFFFFLLFDADCVVGVL